MKDAFLVFDCSAQNDAIVVECIADGHTESRMEVYFSNTQSQQLLAAVNDVCQSAHIALQDVQGIVVVHGSERFTVARMGSVTANSLAWSLQIPVCAYALRPTHIEEMQAKLALTPAATPIAAHYSKEPNITI